MTLRRQALGMAGLILIVMAALTGCPKTTVQPLEQTSATGLPPPAVILVYNFGVNLNEVTQNKGLFQKVINAADSTTQTEAQTEIAHEAASRMSTDLATQIANLGLPAQPANQDTYVPSNALLITGHFIDVNEGNRAQRLVIGFGAGQSRIDTQIQIIAPYTGTYTPALEFETHANSGDMPGAAVTMGAGAAAQGAVTGGMAAANVAIGGGKAYRSGIDSMIDHSADSAVEYLSQFFANQGWIPPDKVKKPMLGGL
jgi:hypothetical protein